MFSLGDRVHGPNGEGTIESIPFDPRLAHLVQYGPPYGLIWHSPQFLTYIPQLPEPSFTLEEIHSCGSL
jgi:hypothetical protein